MNKTVTDFQTAASANPLFAKMWERFCEDGTLAERMSVEAGISKRKKRKQPTAPSASEYSITHGNSLPRRKEETRKTGVARALFSLKNLVAVSLGVLMIGILFLSGASFTGIRQSFAASAPATSTLLTEQIFTESAEDATVDSIYFAADDMPEVL